MNDHFTNRVRRILTPAHNDRRATRCSAAMSSVLLLTSAAASADLAPPVGLDGVADIGSGGFHDVAVLSDGSITLWGDNGSGQTLDPFMATNAIAATGGRNHTLVLRSDGALLAWGLNERGQTDIPAGLNDVTRIAAGDAFNVVLRADGTPAAWGEDAAGVVTSVSAYAGDPLIDLAAGGDFALATTATGAVVEFAARFDGVEFPTAAASDASLAAGRLHACVLSVAGDVACFGDDSFGQASPPAFPDAQPIALAAGARHSLALLDDGTVVAWGGNAFGQADVPPALENVVAISAGERTSLALLGDGSVVTWGDRLLVAASCPGDVNLNGTVDTQDSMLVLAAFGQADPRGDVDRSGTVNGRDLITVLADFGCDASDPNSQGDLR